jgi:pyruvate dehydrogenase E2 component (dihydrolipoamide acetyltransferase)
VFPAGGGLALPEIPPVDFSKFGPTEVIKLPRLKRIGGQNLQRSWINVPHVTQFDEADITELEEFRISKLKEAEQHGTKLTLLSFLMKAVVVALKEHPYFNSSLHPGGEQLTLKKYFHIGFAVNTDGGLMVPVIKDADQKGLFDLAVELSELAQKAREKKLTPSQMQGAGFTISSLGHIGGTGFTPIVNTPEVAILGVSRAAVKPVYENGTFVPRTILPFSVSYDHRVIDGVEGAAFTRFLGSVLSDIRQILL